MCITYLVPRLPHSPQPLPDIQGYGCKGYGEHTSTEAAGSFLCRVRAVCLRQPWGQRSLTIWGEAAKAARGRVGCGAPKREDEARGERAAKGARGRVACGAPKRGDEARGERVG